MEEARFKKKDRIQKIEKKMELKEFIKGVLQEVTGAITKAESDAYSFDIWDVNDGRGIDFDISVEVNNENSEGSKKGIFVSAVTLITGLGSESKSVQSDQRIHRIKFTVQCSKKQN